MKKLVTMLVTLAMAATAMTPMFAYAADPVYHEPITFSNSDEDENRLDTRYSVSASTEVEGESLADSIAHNPQISVSVKWEEMNFQYDFGTYDYKTKEDRNGDSSLYASEKGAKGWAASGHDNSGLYNDYRQVIVSSLSNTTVYVDLNVAKNKEGDAATLYSGVDVYLSDPGYTLSYNQPTRRKLTFEPLKSLADSGTAYEFYQTTKNVAVYVGGKPDIAAAAIPNEELPQLFTLSFTISLTDPAAT